MLVENGIVRVGAEIEVAAFLNNMRYQDVATELLDEGFMEGTQQTWTEHHRYKCDCNQGCGLVRRGDVLVPPIVSIQYDASLPNSGAEFIVSPVLLVDGMHEMRRIWTIITRHAQWRNDLQSRNGPPCSPSIHLHVSATALDYDHTEPLTAGNANGDVLHALSLFAPELLLLSDVEDFRRGLTFRQPWRNADGRNGHHGFVEVKRVVPERMVYIEWRMFEAAYRDWEYFENAAYLSAALTRALLKPATLHSLMRAGYHDPVDPGLIAAAIGANNTAAALGLASLQRLGALRDIIETELDDDRRGAEALGIMFEEVMTRV